MTGRHTGPQKRLTAAGRAVRLLRSVASLLPSRPLPRREPLALPAAPPRNVIVVKADPDSFGTIEVKRVPGCPWETKTTGMPVLTDELAARWQAERQAAFLKANLPPCDPWPLPEVARRIVGALRRDAA